MTKNLLENQYEVNPKKEQDDTHLETEQTKVDIPSILEVQSVEEAVDDTSVLEFQSTKHVGLNIREEGRVENDASVGEVVKIDKVEIPPTLEKEVVTEENVEKIEVKVESETESRDTVETIK